MMKNIISSDGNKFSSISVNLERNNKNRPQINLQKLPYEHMYLTGHSQYLQ